jgi:hypothetical protein
MIFTFSAITIPSKMILAIALSIIFITGFIYAKFRAAFITCITIKTIFARNAFPLGAFPLTILRT